MPNDPYLWITVLSEFALMLLGVVVALHDGWAKRHRGLVLAVFVMVGLFGMGATLRTARRAAQRSAAANAQLAEGFSSLQSADVQIKGQAILITQLQQQLLKSGQTIADLAKSSVAATTGGDSFCYLNFLVPRLAGAPATILLIHQGIYPLHHLSIQMVDLQARKPSFASPTAGITPFPLIDTLPPRNGLTLGQFALGAGDRRDVDISFSAVNGFWTELLRMRKVNGSWREAIEVEKVEGRKLRVIFKSVEKGFPKVNGKVDWGG